MDADVAATDAAIGTDGRPIFLRCVTDQTVKVGTRARFLAEIVSSSSLLVTWFFNGLPVFQPGETAHGRFKILQEGNFYCLEISPVALEDEGAWTCRAVLAETFGSEEGVSATAQLRVMVPKSYKRPEFVEDLQAILTEEGTVSLECKVVGIPTPVLHWFKDGKEIKAGDVFAFRAPQSDSTAEETATSLGIYSCEAINCIGKAVSTSQVRVKNAVQQPTQSQCESAGPPVIIEEPFSQKIRVGEDVRFSVRVMVPPKPVQVKWFNKDVPKEASSKYVLGEDGHGGYSLDISPTDINDDGEWKVAIKNEGVDAESSASAVLTLVVPKNYRPPRFLESLKAILTEEGLVSFECKVVGFPTPQLQWFKDGQELKPGDVYQLSGTNSLGSYSCVARNCMGTAISAAELTVDDIQNQLNEEERLQLMDSHRPPVFAQGLRSSESRVGDPLRLTVQVSSTTENFLVTWFHNDEPIDLDETHKYRSSKEEAGFCHLDVEPLEFSDEGDWKCIVINDFGHAVTSCSVKLTVPRFFRKPHFLEPLRAVLSDEGTVNLECKVIGVPQPSLKWYKDGVELKPGDIHRIMSGQDGTCCLGTYTCEAHNCMGTSSSSAALLGFEDRPEAEQNAALAQDETLLDAEPRTYITEHPRIARNPSLSTIQEERSSQISLYETANAEDTLTEERAEISVSLDGREVSVSLYETPDLTEEEAQQIVELFAEELSERISYRNTTELPPLRFTRETATSGSLLMEAVVIDVPMEINGSGEFSLERTLSEVSFEEAPTEADIEELSAMEALIIEEADQRNDPYFLDDLTIPDLPYEVNDVRRSITGLQEALLVQETCLSDREQPLHLESHSGGATPIVMSPRRLSIEHEEVKIVEDYQIVSADGIQSPADADYYSPLEYSDSCSVLLTSPKTDSPPEEAVCVATPTVQQPAVVEEPVVMATPLSDVAATVPADAPQSAVKGKLENLIMSNKSSLDIRESADETETSADENSQRRTSVVEAPSSELLERKMPSASNELEQPEEVGKIPMIETGQSNAVPVKSKLSAIHLKSDQTSGADGTESGGESRPSAPMPSDGRIQVAEQDGVTCVEECWNAASRLAAAVDTVMDEASVEDHGVEMEQYPSTSCANNAGRLLGSGQESDTKAQSFDTAKDEQEIFSSADAAAPRPATGEAADQGTNFNTRVSDVTTGSKVEQASAASSPIIAEQCSDVPPRFQEVDDRATKDVDAAAELPGNVTSDTPVAITESKESCPTPQSDVKSDDEPVIREELAPAKEKENQQGEIETELADKAVEEAAVIEDANDLKDVALSDKVQKAVEEEVCLQKDAEEEIRMEKDVGPEIITDDAKESNQVENEADVKLQEDVIKNEIAQEAGDQNDVEKIETVKLEELKYEQEENLKTNEEQCQIKEESTQLESGNKNVEAHTNDVEIPAQPKEVNEDEQFSTEVETQEPSSIPAEEKEYVNKEVEMQDEQIKEEEQPTVLNVEEIQEKMDTRQHLNDEIVKEAEEKELLVKEAEQKEILQKQAEEEERLLKETEEKEWVLKETEEKERLLKEAEEKGRLIEEAKETERLKEEAAEQERLQKEAAERERAMKEAEEQELRAKEAEEQERLLLREAEEKERLAKEAEEQKRLIKEVEEKERALQEAEENERALKEAEENERLRKEAEENERLKKVAEEEERLQKGLEEKERLAKEAEESRLKEAEEKERLRMEAEEQIRLKQEAEEQERLLKEAEEKERQLKEAEERDRLLKEAEEQERHRIEAEENERIRKEAEDKERALQEAEEKERLAKEAEEQERLRIEAEENERLLKEAQEKERLMKEAEEKERLLKEAEEKERLLKEAEENERRVKEAEEIEHLKKEAEEAERLKKEAGEAERQRKEAEEVERLKKEAEEQELLLREAIEQASRAVEAEEMERLKQEAQQTEGLPKDSAEDKESLVKETGDQEIPAEEANREQEHIEEIADDQSQTQQISRSLEATSSFLSAGALRSMDVSLPRHSETSHLMAEKSLGRTDSVDRQRSCKTDAEDGDLIERKEPSRMSSALTESSLTEDELIAKQIEEERQQRRREAAEKLLREQEQQASGQADASTRRHEERLRLEQSELHQTVDEHIRKQQQEEEVIQRESEEEKVRLQKQKEEERRIKLEEAEKLRREVEIQERQRREEKEAKRLEAERIQREKEAEEWILKEQERIRLEEEIQRLESERIRMKEERRLRQAKEEEEERLRVKKEREERLRREQEEEERLRREEEEQLRLMKEERERARKQKEEEEERMLREIEERAQRKKEENERLRKEKEEEERLKKEEERQRREEEERKRAEAAEKLRQEAEEKMREKEEKRLKQEEEKKKREEEEKKMKEELRKQKEEEAKKMLEELEAARIKRAEEQKLMAEEEDIVERRVKQTEHVEPAAGPNEAGLNQSQDETLEAPREPVEMKLSERKEDERCEKETALLRKEEDGELKKPEVKAKEDDEMTRPKEREEQKLIEEKERKEAEAKALMEQEERKKAEEKKLKEQQQEKERQAAEEEKRIEEEKQRKEAEEKKRKEQEEKERKEAEELKEKQEKERKEAEQKKLKELQEAEELKLKEQREKEAEEKRMKEQAEKERKEREEEEVKEKERKEKEEKEKQEAEQRKLKELHEAEEKKLKEEAEKVRKEKEEKELKEKERKEKEEKELKEKERAEVEERKKKEEEKKLKEAEELKKKEQQEKERKEAEEKKLKEQKERERQEAEEKKLKERKEAEEKKLKEQQEKERKEAEEKERKEAEEKKLKKQQEKERKEAEEIQLKEQQEKERKERKKKEKLEKERKETEEKQKKEQQEKEAKKAEDLMKSGPKSDIQEQRVKPEEAVKRAEREAGRQVDDARNRSDDESSGKERRRRPITNSDEQTADSSSDNSARTTRTRARPVDESQFDCAVIGSATRRRPVPTVFEEPCDAINQSPSQQQQAAFDGSSSQTPSRQQLSTDFDLHPGTRLSREDMRHGIRSRSAGVASHSMLNRSAYHAESHSNQPEWDSSTKTSEDGRRDPTKKPKFSSKLRDMEVAKGSKMKLTCSLLCNPEPEIEWFRNGCPILKCEDRHRYTTSWNPIGIASLEVRDLTRSDTGEYMCVARNQHGQASTSADVRVRGDYEPKTSSPSFTSSIRDTYHDTSDELVLECSVNGFPTPKITWMKDGIKLHLSSRYKHSLDLDGRCRLVVHSPCVGDSGQYTCVAQNASRKDEISSFVVVPEHVWNSNEMRMKTAPSHAGYSGSAEFYRRQAEREKIASSGDGHGFDVGRYDGMGVPDDSAHFVMLPESTLTVGRDRDLVIQCRVRGHPRPKVTWLKGIRDVAESGRSCVEMDGDLYRFVLKKANYGDGGTYIVKASNCHGTQKAYCTVRVKEAANSSEWDFKDAETSLSDLSERRVRRFNKDVPGPVAAPPMATVSGKNVVSLSWPKPNYTGGAPILAYKVEAWLLGEGAIWIEVATTCITSTDVYNLKPEREYLFRITPRNKYGWGESLVSSTPIKTVSRTGLPHFDRPLQPQIKALEHTDVELLTEVAGEPTPHVEWYRDGTKLDGIRQPRYELRSIGSDCRHALTIHDVRMETDDDSKFTCEAVNPAGRVATFSRVLVVTDQRVAEADALFRQQLDGVSGNDSVVMAPQFTMRPRDRRVQLTFPVRLTCQVIGHPKPDVTWYHNDSAIIIGHDERHSYSVDGNFHTLEIAATKFDDAGIYSVQGRNSSGAVGCQCCLVVDGGIRAYVMPFFTHELEDRTVSEGGTFSLIARVEAYPAVGVLWHRDGIRLRPCRQYDMRLESDGTVALVVSGAMARRHAGVYTCTVTNEMGQVSSNARVTIRQRPLAIPSSSLDAIASDHDNTGETSLAPRFVQKPTEYVEGDSLVVVCEALGDPKPEVIWLRDWLNPRDNERADRFVSEADAPLYKLTVPCVQLDFSATYSVVARNVHGQAKAAVSLQVYVHGGGQGRPNSSETVGSCAPGRSTTLSRVLTAPTVVQPLRHLRCCDGDTVTFECRFNGQPETADSLQIHWLRGGKLLRSCKDFSTEVIAEEGVVRLSIRRVYPEDEGEYTCVAYNGLGSQSTSACLIVDVADDKENDLMVQLDSRPAGTVSARATPRTTPRTTPSRTIRSVSPINSKTTATQQQQQQQQQKSRVRKVPPKFYSVPHNKIAETGETVRFQCNVGGNPSPRVTWDRDNIAIKPETITPAGRVSIEERDDVRVLEIRNVTTEDAGLYRITVENELGRIQANARLDILSRSSGSRSSGFIRSGSAASAGRGAYYSPLSGSSAARLAARSLAMSGASYLRGSSTPRSGGGRYHATSDMDGSSVDGVAAKSNAKQPVSFVQQLPSRMRVNEGDVVELQVIITGTPPLKVVWVQNDVIVVDCPEFRHLDYGDGRYALRLSDAFTHDSGVYFCEAYNRYGEAESWCRLIVSDPTDKLFAETSAEASTTLAYSSANTASIRTHNDDEEEDEEDKIVNVVDDRVADYRDDEDVFSCSKEDLTYESDKLNDELDNPFQVAAQIVKGPVSVSTLVGSTVLLEALIIGRPEPTVRWLKGGKELVESDRVEMRQADGMASLSLHRITADDSGKYIVMAENTFGMDCHYASLAVEGPPDPGGKPTICEVKADSLTLTWYGSVYDGGSVITGYLVEICETGQPWTVLTSECNSTSYVIHGLAPLRTYQFRVRAKNIHGCSEPSSPSDPLYLQPPSVVEKRDKAVVIDRREEKDHQVIVGQQDDDRDDDDDSHAPQFEHCHVTVQPGEPHFLEKYSVHEELGKGRFGVVYRLVDRASGALRAAKYVRCIKAADREKVYQEVAVMNKLQHPKLLQLAAAYDCPKEIVLVTEYISGGELFERVVADDFTLTERDCILFMRQICEGVGYMHSKSIVHLDLKPENILCQSPNSHRIKLIDFGLARQLDPDQPVRVLFGTPEFIAPEIVSYEPIGCATDMWSLGVVCYVLLSGLSPFMGDNDADTFANITSSDYDFDDDAFAAISSDAKDFISSLLVKRPELRLSAEACLQHKWLAQAKHAMNSVKLPTDRLKKFIIRRKWQKTGTAIRALGRMASLSSASRRNSSSSSTGRRSSRMDSLCEEEQGSVFSSGSSSSRMATSSLTAPTNGTDPVTRIRSPSLPVVTHPCQSSGPNPGIARSRSPSLPATGPAIELPDRSPPAAIHVNNSPRRVYYADRSDSGISDCSNHSSTLLSGSHMPTLIQEEEDDEYCVNEMSALTNGCSSSDRLTGGTFLAQKSAGHGGQHALKGKSVVSSRHSLDSAIDGE